MNKKALVIVAVVSVLVLVSGGAFAYSSNQNSMKNEEKMAMAKKTESEAMMKQEETTAMEKDKMAKDAETTKTDSMTKTEDAMTMQGSYVTLANYTADPTKYANTKKVYFFHASWCPICQGIEKEIKADMSKIPAGVTIIKTDFDTSAELIKKYGVTYQYTFVQVDDNGNEVAQWSASNLEKALNGIKS